MGEISVKTGNNARNGGKNSLNRLIRLFAGKKSAQIREILISESAWEEMTCLFAPSLGTDEAEAMAIAIEANKRLAEQQTRQIMAITDRISTSSGKSISTNTWLERYWKIQQERLKSGDIKENTIKQKAKPVSLLKERVGMKLISAVNVRDVAQILDEYLAEGQPRMAQVIRSVLIDVFKEAQHAGEVPPGYNPALATKQPRRKITRQRLTIEEWQKIFDIADENHKYMGNAMLLAIVTGQRLGDISRMKFSDIWDDHLHVEQEKTGSKIAIPLALRCNAINWSGFVE